jgi:hypothetical protein
LSKKKEYDSNSIKFPISPKPVQKADGSWVNTWIVLLGVELVDSTKLEEIEQKLSNKEVTVKIVVSENQITIEIHTHRWSLEDDLIFYPYKVLREINDNIGEVKTIHGQEKNLWPSAIWSSNRYRYENLD